MIACVHENTSFEVARERYVKGVEKFPAYLPLHSSYSYFFQPKWNAETTDKDWHVSLVETLVKAKLSEEEKSVVYGVIVREKTCKFYDENTVDEVCSYFAIDKQRFLKGLGIWTARNADSSNWPDEYLDYALLAEDEKHVIEALKLCDGFYNGLRWKDDEWFAY